MQLLNYKTPTEPEFCKPFEIIVEGPVEFKSLLIELWV